MKKVIEFFALFLSFIGIIGGIGYTAYEGAYPLAVGIGIAGYMAFPKWKGLFNDLKS